MAIEFDKIEHAKGLKFRHSEDGNEMFVIVHDKFPEMGEVHIEGRRYVEVSVEMFVQMAWMMGYDLVKPEEESGAQ